MSIQITTRLPVINGFVQVPSARIAYKTTLVPSDVTTAISDSLHVFMLPRGTEWRRTNRALERIAETYGRRTNVTRD
jgi:hypothetical protein